MGKLIQINKRYLIIEKGNTFFSFLFALYYEKIALINRIFDLNIKGGVTTVQWFFFPLIERYSCLDKYTLSRYHHVKKIGFYFDITISLLRIRFYFTPFIYWKRKWQKDEPKTLELYQVCTPQIVEPEKTNE